VNTPLLKWELMQQSLAARLSARLTISDEQRARCERFREGGPLLITIPSIRDDTTMPYRFIYQPAAVYASGRVLH
jgi:hypothetical protein